MSCSGRVPGGDPPTSNKAIEARLRRMRSPCLEFADTSWECGRETLSLLIDARQTRGPLKYESGRRGQRYRAGRRPPGRPDYAVPVHANNLAYSMEHTMTTMMEGFMTRLDARRDAEPRQETDSEVAEASLSPAGMVHKQEQCDARGGKGSIKDMGRHAPPPLFSGWSGPQVGKGEIGVRGVATPLHLTRGGRSQEQDPVE